MGELVRKDSDAMPFCKSGCQKTLQMFTFNLQVKMNQTFAISAYIPTNLAIEVANMAGQSTLRTTRTLQVGSAGWSSAEQARKQACRLAAIPILGRREVSCAARMALPTCLIEHLGEKALTGQHPYGEGGSTPKRKTD